MGSKPRKSTRAPQARPANPSRKRRNKAPRRPKAYLPDLTPISTALGDALDILKVTRRSVECQDAAWEEHTTLGIAIVTLDGVFNALDTAERALGRYSRRVAR